jgi:hypothetical protein
MREIFRKIASLLMACAVLFSTLSVTVHEHYCGGELVDQTLFLKADTCGMEMPDSGDEDCPPKMEVRCCDDLVKIFEGQQELKKQTMELDLKEQLMAAAFLYTYVNLFDGLQSEFIPFKEYSPPLLFRDIQLLDEVFLI